MEIKKDRRSVILLKKLDFSWDQEMIRKVKTTTEQLLIQSLKEKRKMGYWEFRRKMRRGRWILSGKLLYGMRWGEFGLESGLLADGLFEYAYKEKDTESFQILIDFYRKIKKKKKFRFHYVVYPDQLIHANVVLKLKYLCGIDEFDDIWKDGIFYIKWAVKNSHGLIYYRFEPELYVDTLGMITDFLLRCSEFLQNDYFRKIAENQMDFYLKYGLDSSKSLPYHVLHSDTCETEGLCVWGRGCGWFLIGVTMLAEVNEKYIPVYKKSVEIILETQNQNGYLYHNIEKNDFIDSSVTAIVGNCLHKGLEHHWLEEKYWEHYEGLMTALKQSIDDDGYVLYSSGDCIDVNIYTNKENSTYAQGQTLKCMV